MRMRLCLMDCYWSIWGWTGFDGNDLRARIGRFSPLDLNWLPYGLLGVRASETDRWTDRREALI